MKKNKVKGFTLIELIVVMAIFSIILAGAMSLMIPSQKIMLNAEHLENGQNAVTSISSYIQSEISPAEYLHVYNTTNTNPENAVKDFTKIFYGGVIIPGSTVDSFSYGRGQIHVLKITNDCHVEKWIYEASYDITAACPPPTLISHEESAINRAFYDSYAFEILPGSYTSVSDFEDTMEKYLDPTNHTVTAASLMSNITVTGTKFSFKGTTLKSCSECGGTKYPQGPNDTTCPAGHTWRTSGYSFVDNSSMSLINMVKHSAKAISGHYFVIDQRHVDDDGDPSTPAENDDADPSTIDTNMESYIADRASDTLSNPQYVGIYSAFKADSSATGTAANGYTFIYSYASEQLLP